MYEPEDYIDLNEYLSDNNLIPHIYYIDNEYVLMDYIDGYTLYELWLKYNKNFPLDLKKYLRDKIKIEISKWYKNNVIRGDLHESNILISPDLKHIYLIDPKSSESEEAPTIKKESREIFKELPSLRL